VQEGLLVQREEVVGEAFSHPPIAHPLERHGLIASAEDPKHHGNFPARDLGVYGIEGFFVLCVALHTRVDEVVEGHDAPIRRRVEELRHVARVWPGGGVLEVAVCVGMHERLVVFDAIVSREVGKGELLELHEEYVRRPRKERGEGQRDIVALSHRANKICLRNAAAIMWEVPVIGKRVQRRTWRPAVVPSRGDVRMVGARCGCINRSCRVIKRE